MADPIPGPHALIEASDAAIATARARPLLPHHTLAMADQALIFALAWFLVQSRDCWRDAHAEDRAAEWLDTLEHEILPHVNRGLPAIEALALLAHRLIVARPDLRSRRGPFVWALRDLAEPLSEVLHLRAAVALDRHRQPPAAVLHVAGQKDAL